MGQCSKSMGLGMGGNPIGRLLLSSCADLDSCRIGAACDNVPPEWWLVDNGVPPILTATQHESFSGDL